MSGYVPAEIRRAVIERAESRCEYCLIHQDDTWAGCEIDHIISEKHGGATILENLALACVFCNRAKGTDLASIDSESGMLIRFFHPREDRWQDHFQLQGASLLPLTPVGRVTAHIFGLNLPDRISERETLQFFGRYPVRF